MKQTFTHTYLVLLLMLAASCTPEIEPPVLSSGSLDFSRFIAVGDGFTAGVMNAPVMPTGPRGGLYPGGQQYSFPNLIAAKAQEASGTVPFHQPEFPTEGSGFSLLSGFRQECSEGKAIPTYSHTLPTSTSWRSKENSGEEIRNWGIPGMRLADIQNPDSCKNNPYMWRLLEEGSITDETHYSQVLLGQQPSFFTFWMGTKDFLNYGYFGGVLFSSAPPSPAISRLNFSSLIQQFLQNNPNTKGAVATIPDITRFPFFQSVPKTFTHPNRGCEEKPVYITIQVPGIFSRTDTIAARVDDLILMSFQDSIGQGRPHYWGSPERPIPDKYVLDKEEVSRIRSQIAAYNQMIRAEVEAINLEGPRVALVDMAELFDQEINRGLRQDGLQLSGEHLYGHFFSVDGIHPCPRGYAVIANYFIQEINAFFPGTTIPPLTLSNYSGVRFP
ncbi:MAG: SGNH/GDSL hydrolase family protein [Bacteroidota bacterium]